MLAFLLIIAMAALGLSRLTTEASLTKAFHAGTPEHEVCGYLLGYATQGESPLW